MLVASSRRHVAEVEIAMRRVSISGVLFKPGRATARARLSALQRMLRRLPRGSTVARPPSPRDSVEARPRQWRWR
eukprot:7713270-Pyramimonas_sp.AAC.1